jgi:D-beta-D-heptose 7-phosphate kinase/D-beta-D-heptose 1-phosphate adenosyltransferase
MVDPATLSRLSQASVLVVGDVMLDRYFFGDSERISPEAPVPVVRVTRTEERAGGAANVARNIAHLNGQVTLLVSIRKRKRLNFLLNYNKRREASTCFCYHEQSNH